MMYKRAIKKCWSKKLVGRTAGQNSPWRMSIWRSGGLCCWKTNTLLENQHPDCMALSTTTFKMSTVRLLRQKNTSSSGQTARVDSPEYRLWDADCEDLAHFLLHWPVLFEAWGRYLNKIRQLVICWTSVDIWYNICSQEDLLLQTIIDCSCIPELIKFDCNNIERYFRYHCAALFNTRARMLYKHNERSTRNVTGATNNPSRNKLEKTAVSQEKISWCHF